MTDGAQTCRLEDRGLAIFAINVPCIQTDVVEGALRAYIERTKTAWPG